MPSLTIPQAAERVGRDPSLLRRLARQGRLPGARKVGRDWLVTEAGLRRFAATERPSGRPPSR